MKRKPKKFLKNYSPLLAIILFSLPVFSCKTANNEKTEDKYPNGILVTIEIQLAKPVSGGSIAIYESLGDQYEPITQIALESEKQTYHLRFRIPAPGIYLLGSSPKQGVFLALGADTDIALSLDYPYFAQTTQILRGEESKKLLEFLRTISTFQGAYQQLANQYWSNLRANVPSQNLQQKMDSVLKAQNEYLKTYLAVDPKKYPNIKRLAYLFYFPPYQEVQSQYPNEMEYVINAFWETVALQDTLYGYIPHTFDKAQFYARTLAGYPIPPTEILQLLTQLIQKTPKTSRLRILLYKGFIYGLYNQNKDLYASIGEKFVQEFSNDPLAKKIAKEIQTLSKLRVGAIAPELVLQTPEGDTIRLSDFRGKITLIDFWASWCGPCRRENPNVVRLYHKFHPKGFEIFGVSLDQNRERWIRAIQQDGLVWKHGSDLKGWQSIAAQTYGVNAIPYTVLIDQNGRILAKGLRGKQLEAFLEQLFQ